MHFERIDKGRGSAAGYIAKYICKNIDGKNAFGESIGGDDEADGRDVVQTAERVLAWASLWGMGVKKFKETGRDVYVSDDLFWRVFRCADYHIRQLMLVAYLCSQRVSDTLNLKVSDFREGALWVHQAKSGQRLRVALVGEFAEVVEQIMAEREDAKHDFLFSRNGRRISYNQLRYGLDKARRLAGVEKDEFQFRDLRAKAGTDKDEEAGLSAAKDLLGHKNSSMTVHYVRHRKGKLVNPTRMGKFRDYVEQDGKCRTNEQACGNEKPHKHLVLWGF